MLDTKYIKQKTNGGFTLIEMLVSLSLFTIVVTIVAGSLLVLINNNQTVQAEQSAMTTLSFAMDSMTREIRTGLKYYCANSDFRNQEAFVSPALDVNDCPDGKGAGYNKQGLSFVEAGNSITSKVSGATRIAYYFDNNLKTILRRVGNTTAAESIIPSGITVTNAEFFVTGSEALTTLNTDTNQPTVTIVINALDASGKSYVLQTTITQRGLDI